MSNNSVTDVEAFETRYIVVNPTKLFPSDDPSDWARVLSNQGMLKLYINCQFGVSGIQGTISLANPPGKGDEYEDMWEASKSPGVWDYYSMLGFMQIPNEEGYTIKLFFMNGTFYDRCHETICTVTMERPDNGPGMVGNNLETVWAHIYKEVFVKNFDAAPLAGHKWTNCPCDECSSPTSNGICSTPLEIYGDPCPNCGVSYPTNSPHLQFCTSERRN